MKEGDVMDFWMVSILNHIFFMSATSILVLLVKLSLIKCYIRSWNNFKGMKYEKVAFVFYGCGCCALLCLQ